MEDTEGISDVLFLVSGVYLRVPESGEGWLRREVRDPTTF